MSFLPNSSINLKLLKNKVYLEKKDGNMFCFVFSPVICNELYSLAIFLISKITEKS